MLYSLYKRRLRRQLKGLPKPQHVAIAMDGNRRWARGAGYDDVRIGHRFGAEHLELFLQWCADRHLYVPGLPGPELVIRTSGELRMSDFMLWQATRSEIEFCDLYWPAFREVDLLRALRTYGHRRLQRFS